jgi:hypothetical protein
LTDIFSIPVGIDHKTNDASPLSSVGFLMDKFLLDGYKSWLLDTSPPLASSHRQMLRLLELFIADIMRRRRKKTGRRRILKRGREDWGVERGKGG